MRRVRVAPAFVWLTSVRDLRWRWRRFVIAAMAAALVLSLTVLLSGIVAHLDDEVRRTVDATGADAFLVASGVPGPFTSVAPIDASLAAEIAGSDGVTAAAPMIGMPQTIEGDTPLDAYVIGFVPGGLGEPPVAEGDAPTAAGQAAVDEQAGLSIGDTLVVGGRPFDVVGVTSGLTVLGERPNIYLTLADAQEAFFGGNDVASTILVTGQPTVVPAGLDVVDRAAAVADLRRPMGDTIDSISLFRSLLWLVAAAIVGSVLYLSALERSRDMAVLKATGAEGRDLVIGLVLQAVVLALGASVVAIVIAELLKPVFPAGISLPVDLLAKVPIVAVVVGVLGSLAGLRRVLRADPALAFAGAG